MTKRIRHASLLIALGGLGLVAAALAARTLVGVSSPPMSSCLGSPLSLGDRYEGMLGPAQGFRITIYGPRGGKVWEKQWAPGEQVRWWPLPYTPRQRGKHRIVYANGAKAAEFDVLVVKCRAGAVLELNDRGSSMLSLTNAKPGSVDTSCIVVTYAGQLPAVVRLYGRTRGTLDRYLNLRVVRGRLTEMTLDSCEGFKPDAENYIGAGRGVVYQGTLRRFPDSHAAAQRDPSGKFAREWRSGESHAYKFVISVQNRNAAQGRKALQRFTWEASVPRRKPPRCVGPSLPCRV